MSEKIACKSCGGRNPKHLCPYCRCESYCNEQCAMVGWNAHQDECNVVHVSSPTATAFVPYFGEESFDERQLEDVDPQGALHQTYIVHYTDPAGAIAQHTVEPILGRASLIEGGSKLGDGANPKDLEYLKDRKYSMTIAVTELFQETIQKAEIRDLSFDGTAIYRGADGTRGKLAKLNLTRFYNKDRASLVLWPGSKEIKDALAEAGIRISSQGAQISIALIMQDTGVVIAAIAGSLEFGKRRSGVLQFFKRGFKSILPFQTEFQLKMGGKRQAALETLVMLRGSDAQGNAVQLTFQVNRDKQGVPIEYVDLVDVEVSIPLGTLRIAAKKNKFGSDTNDILQDLAQVRNSIPFHLDADNLDHVSGLLMAMEQQMDERHYEDLAIIQEHQKKLEHSKLTGEEYSTPPAVQAVVYDVSNQMFKQIGLRWKAAFDTNYYDLHKNDVFDGIKAEVETLELPKPGDSKAKIASWIKGKKGKAMGRVRAIQQIINERMAAIGDRKNEMYQDYAKLLTPLATVLNVQQK